MAPLTAGAHDIEQAVQHLPHIGRPGPSAGFRRRDERLDQAVLIIAQRLTGAKVSNQRTIQASTSQPPSRKLPTTPPNGPGSARQTRPVTPSKRQALSIAWSAKATIANRLRPYFQCILDDVSCMIPILQQQCPTRYLPD